MSTDIQVSIDDEPEPNLMDRRAFLRKGAMVGAATLLPAAGLVSSAVAEGGPHQGDVAILKFLAAAELIEEDLWKQYTELSSGNDAYKEALEAIDEAFPRYISDATDDEHSHAAFINAILREMGQSPVNLNRYRTLPPVPAQGANQSINRLTNLRSLNVDTSWFFRYRGTGNPDLGDTFQQIVNIQHRPGIPTSDTMTEDEIKAAAYTAAFHFPTIEQGGTSLYVNMIGKVHRSDALRVVASIGPVEAFHFSTFEGSLEELEGFDAGGGLVFPDLKNNEELGQGVLPRPCAFLRRNLPLCSIIRPTSDQKAGATAAVNALIAMNLFMGQSNEFLQLLRQLARDADNARRGF